jgi:hypothetical protein
MEVKKRKQKLSYLLGFQQKTLFIQKKFHWNKPLQKAPQHTKLH